MTQFLRRLVCAVTLGFVGTSISSAQGGGALDTAALWGVAHHEGTWIAVGEQGVITKSVDALNWTNGTLAPASMSAWLLAVARGDPGWVVVGDGGVILFSADGTTWEQVATGGVRLNGVAWGGGRFLAVGEAGTVRTSTDGRTWSAPRQVMPEGFLRAVAYGDGVFLVGGQRGRLFRTADAASFDELYTTDLNIEALTWDGRFFHMSGEAGLLARSRRGDRWELAFWGAPPPWDGYFRGVASAQNSLVAVGANGLWYNSDASGAYYVASRNLTSLSLNAVVGGSGKLVAVGAMRTRLARDIVTTVQPSVVMPTLQSMLYRGDSVTLSPSRVHGSGPLSFQWLKGGVALEGETADQLTLADLQPADAGAYTLRVQNALGSVVSGPVEVVVNYAPPSRPVPGFAAEVRPVIYRRQFGSDGLATASRDYEVQTIEGIRLAGGAIPRQSFVVGNFVAPAGTGQGTEPGRPRHGLAAVSAVGILAPFELKLDLVAGSRPQVFGLEGRNLLVAVEYYPTISSAPATRLLRVDGDGNIDPGFTANLSLDGAESVLRVEVLPEGGYLVLYQRTVTTGVFVTELKKLRDDGSFDPAFAVDANVPARLDDVALLENGRLLWTAHQGADTMFGRLLADGTVDPEFSAVTRSRRSVDPAVPAESVTVAGRWVRRASGWLLVVDPLIPPGLSARGNTVVWGFDSEGNWRDEAGVALIAGGVVFSAGRSYFALDYSGSSLSRSERWRVGLLELTEAGWNDRELRSGGSFISTSYAERAHAVLGDDDRTWLQVGTAVEYLDAEGRALPNGGFRLGLSLATQPAISGRSSIYVSGSFEWVNGVYSPGLIAFPTQRLPSERRLQNLSVRARAGSGENRLIMGAVSEGSIPVDLLVRAAGPALAGYGVNGWLPDPRLGVVRGASEVGTNDDWPPSLTYWFTRAGASPWPEGSKDAAILVPGGAGAFTAVIEDVAGGNGVALGEVYRTDQAFEQADFRLINVSARSRVAMGEDVLIAGFVLSGADNQRVLIRGVGPALVTYGVNQALGRPVLRLYRDDELIMENRRWNEDSRVQAAAASVGAFPLVAGSADTALLIDLPPGNFTAVVSSADGTEGVALIEVYVVK